MHFFNRTFPSLFFFLSEFPSYFLFLECGKKIFMLVIKDEGFFFFCLG